MYYRFGKAFYYLSIILFLFFLLYFYSALPEKVTVQLASGGDEGVQWERGFFFYVMVGFFILLNAGVLIPPSLLEKKSLGNLHRIFPKGDRYRDYFLSWFFSFGGILNVSLAILVLYVHALSNQEEISAASYSFFFYLVPVLLFGWIFAFFLLFISKSKELQNQF